MRELADGARGLLSREEKEGTKGHHKALRSHSARNVVHVKKKMPTLRYGRYSKALELWRRGAIEFSCVVVWAQQILINTWDRNIVFAQNKILGGGDLSIFVTFKA